MAKRALIFSFFLLVTFMIYERSLQLVLAYYVLMPALIFPVFYFFDNADRFFTLAAGALAIALYAVYFLQHQTVEMTLFGAGAVAMFGALVLYRGRWENQMQVEKTRRETAASELSTLKHKHIARLESLHHLEKQVSSLMNLFEIARDFSECLSFDALAVLLYKKVMPELPFHRMRLILSKSRLFTITSSQMQEDGPELTPEETQVFDKVRELKLLQKTDSFWAFPLLAEGEMTAILSVEGADQDDFVKFEVLVAHLMLQVKKIILYDTVKELSILDGLTEVFVRRHFLERFEEELKRCIKYNLSIAVLMLDIDHFKRYNDDFGHLVGDATLKEVASLLKGSLRKVDIVGRFGGEEFIMAIPETQKEGAFEVAERIRSGIARHSFKIYDEETRVTVSIGVALFPQDLPEELRRDFHPELVTELIQRSDRALYKAKEEGRNRVVLYQEL